jgi:hypothetical protein
VKSDRSKPEGSFHCFGVATRTERPHDDGGPRPHSYGARVDQRRIWGTGVVVALIGGIVTVLAMISRHAG